MESMDHDRNRKPLRLVKPHTPIRAGVLALLVLSFAVTDGGHANEPLTQSFEQRRDAPTGPYVAKQRTTVQTLVHAFRNGKLVAVNRKGRPVRLAALPQGVQRRLETRLRDFARAIMPVQRRPTRTVIRELAADPKLAEGPRFEFDSQNGHVKLHLKEELWSATTEFNAFQLGAAIAAGGVYLNSMAESLEE